MNIPNEWVEKAAKQLVPPNSAGQRQYRKQDRDNARAVLEAVLPDILEAVAREIETGIEPEPDSQWDWDDAEWATNFTYRNAARIVRNFGDKNGS
jgi:hypothetical protein